MSCTGTMWEASAIIPDNAQLAHQPSAVEVHSEPDRQLPRSFPDDSACESTNSSKAWRTALSGAAIKNIASVEVLKDLRIPLPPLATQQAIVAEIEAEQALVAANRELIARFEKKIQATLARVWGEDEPSPAEA